MGEIQNASFGCPWKNSDAVLIVEGEELHVHTSVLSLASPVFERMFSGGFKEANSKRVEMKGKTYEMIEHMLSIIYPNKAGSLELKTNICDICLPERKNYRKLACRECRDYTEIRAFCVKCNNAGGDRCVRCNRSFSKSKMQRKQHLDHLQELLELSQEYMMSGIQERITQEIARLSRELSMHNSNSEMLVGTLDLLAFAENIDCNEAVANCLRYISSAHGYSSSVVHNGTLDCLSNLLEEKKVSMSLKLKLMGMILKREVRELVPHPATEKKEAWDDVMSIANELIRLTDNEEK